MSNFKISNAEPYQTDKIVRLVNSAYRGETSRAGWTTEADLLGGQRIDISGVTEILQDPDSALLVLTVEEALLGCVHLRRLDEDSIYLGMLTVQPRLQGKGLGKHLLNAAEQWCQAHGYKKIKMTVIAQRPELISWYGKHGYMNSGAKEKFPYGDLRFGEPKRDDLYFLVLEKNLAENKKGPIPGP